MKGMNYLYGKVTILVIYYLGEKMLKKTANTQTDEHVFEKSSILFRKSSIFSENQAFVHQDSKSPR